MIKVFKGADKMVYIGTTDFGSTVDFQVQRSGDKINVYRPNRDVFEIKNLSYTRIADGDGNGFNNAADTEAYLNEVFADTVFLEEGQFSVYEATAATSQSLTSTPTRVNMDVETLVDSSFALSSGSIVAGFDGWVKLTYSISADGLDGDRATGVHAVYLNNTEVVKSRSYSYHRSLANGEGTASKSILLEISDGDEIEIRSSIFGDEVSIIPGVSNILIERFQ